MAILPLKADTPTLVFVFAKLPVMPVTSYTPAVPLGTTCIVPEPVKPFKFTDQSNVWLVSAAGEIVRTAAIASDAKTNFFMFHSFRIGPCGYPLLNLLL